METRSKSKGLAALAVFVIANALLSSFYLDTWITPNSTARALTVLTVVKDGTLQIDRYKDWTQDKAIFNGHYYSDKSPVTSAIVLPFYWVLCKLGLDKPPPGKFEAHPIYLLGDLLCSVIPFNIFLLFLLSEAGTALYPIVLVCLAAYSSFFWAYVGGYHGHILSALLLLLAYRYVREHRRPLLAGLLAGLAAATEYPLALAIPIFGLAMLTRERTVRKSLLAFCAMAALPLLAVLIYNRALTGGGMLYSSPADPSFKAMHSHYGFGLPTLAGLWGLGFGFYRGLLPHTPVLLVAAFELARAWKRAGRIEIRNRLLVALVLVFWITLSGYFMWDGGWAFGPRHLIPIAFILVYESVGFLAHVNFNKPLFFALCGIGLVETALAKATVLTMVPQGKPWPFFDVILPALQQGKFNENNLMTTGFGFNPAWSAAAWLFLLLLVTLGAANLNEPRPRQRAPQSR